jgi:hypothetical protein
MNAQTPALLRRFALLLALAMLVACTPSRSSRGDDDSSSNDDDAADDDDANDDDANDDDAVGDDDDSDCADYGPGNTWWHACIDDVPSSLNGSGFQSGDTAYNFTMSDQFGDSVELYQFFGKVIVLDLFAFW